MPDPFEQLRAALTPAQPDPAFAARLRERLGRALDLPRGVVMSDLQTHEVAPASAPAEAVITPYLAVSGARSALDWYQQAFGARLHGEPIVMEDGSIGHAELDVRGAALYLAEQNPGLGFTAPDAGTAVTIHLSVADVDTAIGQAVDAGARLDRPAADYPYGRNGVIRDPFGHRWLISGPQARHGLRHGDIGYVSLWVRDVGRAADFFAAVLGWQYAPARAGASRQVEGQSLHHGLLAWSDWPSAGVTAPTLFCCYAVADITTATARVEAAGGTAGQPHREPYGLLSDCTDNQGMSFAVYEPPDGVASGPAAAPTGLRQGDLAYVTMEVPDAARTREFYGSVLGWDFSAGSVPDGWQVDNVAPMAGIAGGHQAAATVPMYRVDDVAAAVDVVRAAGGTATDPQAQPYGITSSCADDQGTRFYLGQLRD
jgi:predicted enzyme related to lactoylglutathione lyase